MNLLSSESQERTAVLESALIDLQENLQRPEVIECLGRQAVRVTSEMLDLLYIPDIHHGELHISRSTQKTEKIPIVGLWDGEIVKFGESVARQTPNQAAILHTHLEQWLHDRYNHKVQPRDLLDIVQRRHLAEAKKPHGLQLTGRVLGAVSYAYSSQHLRSSGEDALVYGRPVVGIRVDTPNPKDQTLAHELDHAHKYLTNPILRGSGSDIEWRIAYRRYLELSAGRIGARYGLGLYDLPGYKDSGNPDLLNDLTAETIRERLCNPERPFEPTPEMMHEIWNETRASWSSDDFMRQAA